MKILKYIGCCLIGLAASACSDLYETHKEYLDMGEETYIGRADSLQAYGGFKRIEVKWKLNADSRISKCLISWNGGKDVKEVVAANHPNEYLSTVLENMPEGKYLFSILVIGESGKESLPQTISGEVYGDNYKSRLAQRGIKSMSATPKGVTINWLSEEKCLGVNLSYTNKAGVEKKLSIDIEETTTMIEDFVPGTKFSITSIYKPEINAIDIIESLPSTVSFPTYYTVSKEDWDAIYHADYTDISRAGWTTEANTEELEGEGAINGRAATILDGDLATFWHSKWKGGTPPMPHSIIIDMQKEESIMSVELARRKANPDLKTAVFGISNDKVNWTDLGKLTFPAAAAPNAQTLLLAGPATGRYIRILVTESNNAANASISEVMFTKNKE